VNTPVPQRDPPVSYASTNRPIRNATATDLASNVETVVGRLAMVGFISGATAEVQRGLTIGEQFHISEVPVLLLSVLLLVASYFPISRNARKEPFGYFTPVAETLNGRLAMLGFSSLVVLEAATGAAFF
jgi:hypothetical protein